MAAALTLEVTLETCCAHCFTVIPPTDPFYILCRCQSVFYCSQVCQQMDLRHSLVFCAQEPHFIPRSVPIQDQMHRFFRLISQVNLDLPLGNDPFSFENSIMVNCLGFDPVRQEATCWSLLVRKTTVLRPEYCNPPGGFPVNNPIAIAFREHVNHLQYLVTRPNLAVIQTLWYDPSVMNNPALTDPIDSIWKKCFSVQFLRLDTSLT